MYSQLYAPPHAPLFATGEAKQMEKRKEEGESVKMQLAKMRSQRKYKPSFLPEELREIRKSWSKNKHGMEREDVLLMRRQHAGKAYDGEGEGEGLI